MARSVKPFPTIDPSLSGSGYEKNQAVAVCVKAWRRTFELASLAPGDGRLAPPHDDSTHFANQQAAIAFIDAMPPLSGPQNVSDFIACVAFAMLKHIFRSEESRQLLDVAKVALASIRATSRTPASSVAPPAEPRPLAKKNLLPKTAPELVQNGPSKMQLT